LRWFGHSQWRAINAPTTMSELNRVEGTKKSTRPKIILSKVVKNDMPIMEIIEHDIR
jgi:hypothetical protein